MGTKKAADEAINARKKSKRGKKQIGAVNDVAELRQMYKDSISRGCKQRIKKKIHKLEGKKDEP